MGYKGDQRLKMARWLEFGTDSSSLTGDTRERDLDQSKRWIKRSSVDSRELRIQSTRLKYEEGRTGKIQMKHGSEGSPGKLSIHRERLGE